MKFKLIILLLFFTPLRVWAITQDNSQEMPLKVSIGDDGIYIVINGKDAMDIYNYLKAKQGDCNESSNLFLISDHGMGKAHISTPVIHCQKATGSTDDPPKKEDDPSLYLCDISISRNGTSIVP